MFSKQFVNILGLLIPSSKRSEVFAIVDFDTQLHLVHGSCFRFFLNIVVAFKEILRTKNNVPLKGILSLLVLGKHSFYAIVTTLRSRSVLLHRWFLSIFDTQQGVAPSPEHFAYPT
ncbi:MAG: hypothetical protein ACI9MS_003065 [Glaciecola sp.]|jgi:hypothetical protein